MRARGDLSNGRLSHDMKTLPFHEQVPSYHWHGKVTKVP